MRYITIPETVTIRQGGKSVQYPFTMLLETIVYTHEVWRSDPLMQKHFFSIVKKFDGAEPGDVVALTDKEFEAFEPIATMQGEKLGTAAAVPLNQLMAAVLQSSNEAPDEVKKENAKKAVDALKGRGTTEAPVN